MENFAAIDFETANEHPTSACSVGVVVVRGGQVYKEIYSLIKPEPEYYLYRNSCIHGLTQADTCCAPIFPEVWATIVPHIEHVPLVAHNKAFDEHCLKALFRMYQMNYPDYPFLCTLQMSRQLKGLPNHKLHTVCSYLGYSPVNAHHALSDARACAYIAQHLNPQPR